MTTLSRELDAETLELLATAARVGCELIRLSGMAIGASSERGTVPDDIVADMKKAAGDLRTALKHYDATT